MDRQYRVFSSFCTRTQFFVHASFDKCLSLNKAVHHINFTIVPFALWAAMLLQFLSLVCISIISLSSSILRSSTIVSLRDKQGRGRHHSVISNDRRERCMVVLGFVHCAAFAAFELGPMFHRAFPHSQTTVVDACMLAFYYGIGRPPALRRFPRTNLKVSKIRIRWRTCM